MGPRKALIWFQARIGKKQDLSASFFEKMKAAIGPADADILWMHNGHSRYIFCVRLSSDEKYVMSSGADKKVLLAETLSGNILSSFSDFSINFVSGVIWVPGNQEAIVWSDNEVVWLLIQMERLEKRDEVKRECLGLECINGASVSWGDSSSQERSFLVLGERVEDKPSKIVKLFLR